MQLPKLAIQNYQFVLVLLLLVLISGTLSFLNMPRSEDPALDFPTYSIVGVYPGTSPEDMEELVVEPIEEVINEVENIDQVTTTIEEGLAVIRIDGEFGLDIDEQFDEVQSKVNQVRNDLPDGLIRLDVRQISPQDVKILQLALISEGAKYAELVETAEKLEDKLTRVNGVRNVAIEAYPEEEVRIAIDMEKMARYNIGLNQLTGIIQANNANIPGGEISANGQNFTVKTSGGYKSIEQLKNTIISSDGRGMVFLKDIADVYMDYEDETYVGRFNGKEAIFISLTQKKGVNILQLTKELDKAINKFKEGLAPNMELAQAFVQAPAVESRINEFFGNLLQGILLVGLIIMIFLGIRNSLIIMTVIPTSILIAVTALDITGFGLQQISIAGLVIALGLLVDNGIVVIENINRYLGEGFSVKDAAVKGTQEVGWAIVSSTVTTVLAFLPVTQLGGGVGQFIQTLPLTVIYSLLASLVLALVLTPLLGSRLMKAKEEGQLGRVESFLKNVVKNLYRPMLEFSLKRPWLVITLALATLGGSVALFPYVGVSFFPTADKPLLLVDIDTPRGSDLAQTNRAALFVETVLDSSSMVQSYISNVGHGNPQIYYNIIPKNFKKNHSQLIVNLQKWEEKSFYALIDELRETFSTYPGAKISVRELKNGPPYEAPIAIKVLGDDLDVLRKLSEQVEGIIAAEEGTINMDNPLSLGLTNLRTEINRDKAGMMGVQLVDIDMAVRTAIAGNELGSLNTKGGKEYEMVARLNWDKKVAISDLDRVSLTSFSGAQVPLQQLVNVEFESSAAQIDHFDLQRANTVTADLKDGYNSTEITLRIIEQLKQMDWPDGYDYYVAGEFETQQESFGSLGQMLLIAIFGIFAVLILQFRSFAQPFIVISAIPLAFSGSIVGLFLTGYSFSFFAFIGFTSLVGIVVNTSIILVDYTNQLIEQGMPMGEALRKAAETRFNPILLTTITTISGLLPLTISGSNLWAPLCWTIIGGMISSTLLTLLIVPILYQWLSKGKVKTTVN
ncbi:MAG: efflux RND transporter permease subunit [Bacteroidia bacterium]|nr:efflux RND transporter permease subunit [Bacteroidia bacterium]